MRYANGLLKEGRKLLHWLTHIFVGAFILNLLLIWPVKYIWRGQNYQDSVKGKLCMKANFTSKFGTDVELSLKPILILISHALVFWGLMHFYFFSSLKIKYVYFLFIQSRYTYLNLLSIRKRYCISKRQQNLIDLKLQYLFTNLMVLGVFVDQLKNAFLQVHSKSLGQDMTFNIWWIQFYFENIGE